MPTEVTRYKCDFCKRHYAAMSGAKRHERVCFFNPANRSCITCIFRDSWKNSKTGSRTSKMDPERLHWCFETEQEMFRKKVLNCPKWENGDPEYDSDYDG